MKKYLIVGTGGTGGPVGAYLARAGKDVTFIARGDNLKAMREQGLRVIRPRDEFTIAPVRVSTLEDYEGQPDVIFVCVKGYSLDSVIPELQRIAGSSTVIIPILNIFGTGGQLQKHFPNTLVTDGCIYVAAQLESPGCIRMNGDILRVIFGVRDPSDLRDDLREIEADLIESGITGLLSDNIARDALLKFSYVSPQGACGLYYNVPSGDIQHPGEIRDCFAGLIAEIGTLARAMGITFEEDIVERNLKILDTLSPDAATSLQRDIAARRPSEIDGLICEVVRLADSFGLDLPLYRKIEAELRARGLMG
ncbi:MAG: 2-dehydropantoate 2-reductase [Ruminococcus sp.]|nr:2-dehydropantoate 2-reductase [Ruminococcus sp.]